mmetsp:Transcript_13578/g.21197  ORF Transcript_13578/g.21197 Transcript_13578/m.21197 type:complete len:201 (+) Transcript_13578:451-1053(+)
MHKQLFIHRDVKPDNFLMGLGDKSSILHVVDMGLAKRYIDPVTNQHLAFRDDKSLTGTARYASVHAHKGEELSRRDDFEAIGYVLVYLYTGYLPWQNLHSHSKNERYQKIKEKKISTSVAELCKDCPTEFNRYMDYCKNLKFTEEPDYKFMKEQFASLAKKEDINLEDNLWDWSVRAVTIKNHPEFYDFLSNSDVHPLTS